MRKTETITIKDGRDKGKRFLITEPDAFTGEHFYIRFASICGELTSQSEMFNVLNKTAEGRQLWSELINFVQIIPGQTDAVKRPIEVEDIEDFQTLVLLRFTALRIVLGFTGE